MNETFASRLKKMRKDRGWTQTTLAKCLGVSRSTVSMYELGIREPDFDTLESLADLFNIPMSAIIDKYDDTVDDNVDKRIFKIHDIYMQLNSENRELALVFLQAMLDKQ